MNHGLARLGREATHRATICWNMPIEFHHHQLPNGLTIIAETLPQAYTAAVGFYVRTGARDEQPSLMGVSHFLEHMMFKGTARRSADDVNREFDEIGADYNAFTSEELTAYWAHVLPEFLPRSVDLLADMLQPALRSEDFEIERKVILEEIGMYEDRPHWRLFDAALELHYSGHPLGHRVLGTQQTVSQMTAEQMRHYFQKHYAADNIVVAAAGNLDFNQLVDQLARMTEKWNGAAAQRSYAPVQLQQRLQEMVDPRTTRHYMTLLSSAPSAQDPRRYAARILSQCLGDDDGSRIYWALIDPGLADEADLSYSPQDQAGNYMAFASCDPERAEQVERVLLETIDRFADDVEEEEIERARNKIATGALLSSESPGGRMRFLGGQWSYLGGYLPLEVELQRLTAISLADVRQVAREFPFQPRTLVRLGPGNGRTQVGATATSESSR